MRFAFAAGVIAVALVAMPGTAVAEPVAPQPGTSCSAAEKGALTKVADDVALECAGGQWKSFDGPYPSSDRWLSYGPALKLHGQGMRNPEIMSGEWTATPQDAAEQCRAAQAAVVSAGEVGPVQVTESRPGEPLDFEVLPVVFTIELSGDCVWQKAGW